ncbi:hypothetical protein Y032_0002g636 [Ancylostoma ceylanicum]|uniref:K Homology domain-containing protein n=1 Tax=Ancylostoma ceylanicum TaxID=53326 RepID=A0A016W1L7_9BILA|nr:hypothetical protein Y032_0002g636 [Ancylostoma ceylanicum]
MADHDSHNDEGNPLSVIHSAGTKRTQDSYDGPASKRAHVDGDDNNLAVKILIPSAAVGAIIGKGGEAMRNLKNDHQCRVQMSKSSETYPGTSERICLVKGRVQNVIGVIDVILQKIREKCEGSTSSDAFDHKGVSRGNEVKIVMPNTSAGMVIGKSGANIKDIRETYGCQIQVFPKAGSTEAQNSLERIVTLAHEDHSQLIQATARVLEKVVADPHHTSEINKEDFGNKSGGARVNIFQSQ